MPQTPRIQNVLYVTGNMRRARSFYEDLIGPRLKFADGDRWTQYELAGQNFALSSFGEAAPLAGGGAVVFEVDTLDCQESRLTELGGRVLHLRDMGEHGSVLVAADLDGNIFQLWTRRAG